MAENIDNPEITDNPTIENQMDGIIASANQELTPQDTTVTETTVDSNDTTVVDENKTVDEQLPEDVSKQNQAFAAMRKQNTDMQKQLEAMKEYIKKDGFDSIEDLITKQQKETVIKEAEEAKLPPEIYERFKQLEQAERQRQEDIRLQQFANQVLDMQKDLSLDEAQLRGFGEKANELGIDLRASQIPLKQLYYALNHESIVEARVEAAKQDWLAEQARVKAESPTVTQNRAGAAESSKDAEDILKKLMQEFK